MKSVRTTYEAPAPRRGPMSTEEPPEGLRRRKTALTQGDEKAKDRTTALLSAAPNQVSAVLEKAGPAIQAVIYVMKIVVVR